MKQEAIALGYTEEIWCLVNGVNECTLLEADVAPPTVNPTAMPVTPSPTPMPVTPSPTKQPVNVEEELNNLASTTESSDAAAGLVSLSVAVTTIIMLLSVSFVMQ